MFRFRPRKSRRWEAFNLGDHRADREGRYSSRVFGRELRHVHGLSMDQEALLVSLDVGAAARPDPASPNQKVFVKEKMQNY